MQHAKKMHGDFYVLENAILQFTQLPKIGMNPSTVLNFSYRSRKLCGDQAVSVTACAKVNELSLPTPARPATCPPLPEFSGKRRVFSCRGGRSMQITTELTLNSPNEPPFTSFWAAEMMQDFFFCVQTHTFPFSSFII